MTGLLARRRLAIPAVLGILVCAAYWRFVWDLPLISDDYLVIGLSLKWGAPDGWPELLQHPLYRARSVQMPITWLVYQVFGMAPQAYSLVSLLLHLANVLLLYATGRVAGTGQRVACFAAGFFAVYEGHQEAVVWYSALPDELALFFGLLALFCWLRYLQQGSKGWLAAAFGAFVVALLSKESAVVFAPLAGLVWLVARDSRKRLPWVEFLAFVLLAGAYTAWCFAGREGNHHFSDGTFSLTAPFVRTLVNSMGRMLWFWGALSLLVVALVRPERWRVWLGFALAWMAVALLPYSFLTYMPRVPSRHTYLATVGLSFVVGFALDVLWRQRRRTAVVVVAAVILHNVGYLWVRKYRQFAERAAPTEELIRVARRGEGPIRIEAFPYNREVPEWAVRLMVDNPSVKLVFDGEEAPQGAPVFRWTDR